MAFIILADDDPLLGELVRFKLEAEGHRVEIVTDGDAACTAAISRRPDLLILDSMMPVLSGPQVLKRLKSQAETATIPVIMLTARKARDDVVEALQSGADDYVTKPFIPDEFILRVRAALAKYQGSDGSP